MRGLSFTSPGIRIACASLGAACSTVLCAAAAEPAAEPSRSGWETPKRFTHLSPHPRLFVSQEQIERMVKGRGEAYAKDYGQVAAAAETGVRDAEDPMQGAGQLRRSFDMLGRISSLAIQWHRTGDRRYLEAAVQNVEGMKTWISPKGPIELWQGQEIAAVAIAYDLLYNDLTPAQRARIVAFARGHCVQPYLWVTGDRANPMVPGEHGSWWNGMVINWNPVCGAGAGMLALTMYEDLPEAQTMVDRVARAFQPIVDRLNETDGGWNEGLGYWNWTMHYLSLFYVSYERATGERVPGFHSKGFREGLLFGTYFVPYDEECGFGDNEHGNFSSSLLLAAEFLGDKDALKQLQEYRARYAEAEARHREPRDTEAAKQGGRKDPAGEAVDHTKPVNIGYGTPFGLLINPDPETSVPAPKPKRNFVHVYPNLGWAMIADQWPRPNVYASVRGGPLGGAGGHAQDNLLSWNGLVGTEKMILSYHQASYYAPAFGGRAWEIYERSSRAKNTIFVAGLPPANSGRGNARAEESRFELPTGAALRLDASSAYHMGRGSARVYRLFAVLGDHGLLVLDRIERAGGPVEVRAHTMKDATFGETDVLLKGRRETARMTFAADAPAKLNHTKDPLTDANATPPTMIRWQTLGSVRQVTMASLLTRGADPVALAVRSSDGLVTVTAEGKGWRREIRLTQKLEPPGPTP